MDERTNIWLPIWLKQEMKKRGKNISLICRNSLLEDLMRDDPNFVPPKEPFILQAICPLCHKFTQTTSVHQVRCQGCGNRFRPYVRREGLRGRLVYGDENALRKAISKLFGGP